MIGEWVYKGLLSWEFICSETPTAPRSQGASAGRIVYVPEEKVVRISLVVTISVYANTSRQTETMGGTNTTNTVHVVSENTLWAIEMEGLSLWLLFIGIMAALLAASVYVSSRNRRRLPPGPRGWPLLGNALDMPRQKEWLTFTEWKRTYGQLSARIVSIIVPTRNVVVGNIVSLSIAGQTIIILNSVKAAMDLLQRRSSIYSDRPRLVMSGEL